MLRLDSEPPVSAQTAARSLLDLAHSALQTVLEQLVPRDTLTPTRVACIALQSDSATRAITNETLTALTRDGLVVVVPARCPKTLITAFAIPDREGGYSFVPPGEDPFHVRVVRVRAYRSGEALVDVSVSRSAWSVVARCTAPDFRIARLHVLSPRIAIADASVTDRARGAVMRCDVVAHRLP